MTPARVREAMLTDPKTLPATASARDAARLLVHPDVRAVLVCQDGNLVGIVTPAQLVEHVVAAGRDPTSTPLGDVADESVDTVEADLPLADAYRLLEERDAERMPVVDGGRLVGVISRSVLQRRLAEDEPPPADGERD